MYGWRSMGLYEISVSVGLPVVRSPNPFGKRFGPEVRAAPVRSFSDVVDLILQNS